ncbi:MAG: hypothetical protein K2X32_09555 [Phycisphaerales bacterium]|nr:hypothetical protein [Phycisphaerales bacterium]
MIAGALSGCARSQAGGTGTSPSTGRVAAREAPAATTTGAVVRESTERYRARPVRVGETEILLANVTFSRGLSLTGDGGGRGDGEWRVAFRTRIADSRLDDGRIAKLVITRLLDADGREIAFKTDARGARFSPIPTFTHAPWTDEGRAMYSEEMTARASREAEATAIVPQLPRSFASVEGTITLELITAQRVARLPIQENREGIEIAPGLKAEVAINTPGGAGDAGAGGGAARRAERVSGELTLRVSVERDGSPELLTSLPWVSAVAIDEGESPSPLSERTRQSRTMNRAMTARMWPFGYQPPESGPRPQLLVNVITATKSVEIPFVITGVPGAE